jgi:3-methyladenine DNA glycosylase AlkD
MFPSAEEILERLEQMSDERNRAGMKRFGINVERAFGVSVPILREIARSVKALARAEVENKGEEKKEKNQGEKKVQESAQRRHKLAEDLWDSAAHEARLIAIFVEEVRAMSERQIETWVRDCDSWDLCDQLCSGLLWKSPYARRQMEAWREEEAEFTRRIGIVLIAQIAVHDKALPDDALEEFFPVLERYAYDERNFVKKAVNWSLRQLGKRSEGLLPLAIACAERIKAQGTPAARWIAADALREFAARQEKTRLKIR